MVRFSDRIVVLGLSVILLSIIGLFALLQRHGHHTVEQAWSSRQRASVVMGAVRRAEPAVIVGSASGSLAEQENFEEEKSDDVQTTISVIGPDAGDELDVSPRERRSSPSQADRKPLPSTKTREKHQGDASASSTEKQSRRRSDAGKSEAQSDDRASRASDQPMASVPIEAKSAPGALASSPDLAKSPASTPMPPDADNRESHAEARPSSTAPPKKTRQDVEDELRQARMNGSLPRFGNPDPYGPGGSPSTAHK
ncbi:hypothetical protein AWB82_02624 [Caballeronia glebae]|uniref:DUF4148 domain-containing protein n=1 Tax=Caballeronia glebae TaxID=1777143 RepID=A0A158AMV1_9BURK|nr:hypothetical protein [Caballeronia glebae]SAK59132.1 hypothetical protein AWB82_02624 [Caballeronia glebae]